MRIWRPSWEIRAVYGDAEKLRPVNRELKELAPVVEAYRAWCRRRKSAAGRGGGDCSHDPDLKEMAQEELAEAKEELETAEGTADGILLLPKDPDDGPERDSGDPGRRRRGGERRCLPQSLLRMYTMYAERRGWKRGDRQHQRNGAGRREGVQSAVSRARAPGPG